MAETIRDVIIRVAIKQLETKLKAPDMAPIKAAIEAQRKAADAAVKSQERVAAATTAAAKAQAIAANAAAKAHESITLKADPLKAHEDLVLKKEEINRASRFKEIALAERMSIGLQRIYERDVAVLQKAAIAHQQMTRRLSIGFLNVAEGVMRFSRGLALLSEGDKDLERIARVLIGFQAGFDVMAGGAKIIQGLTRSITALRIASIAAGTSMAPIAVAAAAITAVSAVIGYGQYEKNKKSERREAQGKLQQETGRVFIENFQGDTAEMETRHEVEKLKTAERIFELNKKDAILEKQRTRTTGALFLGMRPGEKTENIREERIAVGEEQVKIRQKIGALLEGERTRITELYRIEKMRVETIKDAIKAERERVKASNAGFGRLNEMDQSELMRIAQKAKGGGKLTREELEFQEQKGGQFGARASEAEFAARGKGFGKKYHEALGVTYEAEEPLKQLTEALRRAMDPKEGGGGVRPLAEMIDQMANDIKKAGEDVVKAQQELRNERQAANNAILEVLKLSTEEEKRVWGTIRKFRDEQEANRRAMQI